MYQSNLVGARAVAVVVRGHDLLLMKRIKDSREYLIFGGGTIEIGEDPKATVIREVAEEFNLTVSNPQFLFELVNQGRQEFWFLVESPTGVPYVGGPEKERASAINQYLPTWYPFVALKDLPEVYPQLGQAKVVEWMITNHLV